MIAGCAQAERREGLASWEEAGSQGKGGRSQRWRGRAWAGSGFAGVGSSKKQNPRSITGCAQPGLLAEGLPCPDSRVESPAVAQESGIRDAQMQDGCLVRLWGKPTSPAKFASGTSFVPVTPGLCPHPQPTALTRVLQGCLEQEGGEQTGAAGVWTLELLDRGLVRWGVCPFHPDIPGSLEHSCHHLSE